MAQDELKRWRCAECGAVSLETALLTAPNPFDSTQSVMGCPACKDVSKFEEICDEPGCLNTAHCGFPVESGFGGYRRTCSKHSSFNKN